MPMYDFECKACGHTWETIASLSEKPACPSCQSAETERLMAAPKITGYAGISYTSGTTKAGRPKGGPGRS